VIRRVANRWTAAAVFAALLAPAGVWAQEAEKTPPVEAAAPAAKSPTRDCLSKKDIFSKEEIDKYKARKAAAANDPEEFDRIKRAWRMKSGAAAEEAGKPLCSDLKKAAPANPCAPTNPCGGS
jgi:hypothetical protein